jgi:hypothetical protein
MTKEQIKGLTTAKAIDTSIGLITVIAENEDAVDPSLEITETMTRPTTSSIMAALVRTVPSRVFVRPLVPRMVKVVPRLVEHSAAPAAKA